MVIALVQSNKGIATTTTVNPAFSVTPTSGNLIVLCFATDDYNGTPNTGWTQSTGMEQQTFHGGYIWWRTSDGSNPPGGYTIGSATNSAWVMMEFSGIDPTPYDISNGQFNASGANTYTTPAIVPTTGGRLLVAGLNGTAVSGNNEAITSWLNSFTVVDSIGNTTGGSREVTGAAYRLVTGDGSTSFSSGGTFGRVQDARSGLIIAFKETAGGPPPTSGQQIIDIGDAIDDGTGDPVRVAFTKCNANFTELYTADTAFLTTTAAATTYAPLASPTFTGNPQAPTPAITDNDTSIATTEFVKSAVSVANQVFYCDPTDAADVATYKRLLLTPSTHTESSVPVSCTGTGDVLVGAFITDPGVPGAIEYPAGSAYRRLYGSVSAGVARFHLQVYARTTGGVETLARDEFSNSFSNLSATLQEWLATPTSAGALAPTDRIVVKIYAQRVSGPATITVTFYAEGSSHASQIQTTITSGSSAPISATSPLTLAGGNLTIDLSAYQPLDTDLTAIAALTGTNTIYYRSAANTWSPVAIGSNMTFTGGTLDSVAGGGTATPGPPQGRLTISSTLPVMTSTVTGATIVWYLPYAGNLVPIYDGTSFAMTAVSAGGLSCTTTDTTKNPAVVGASQTLDWFIWSDAGTLRIGHGPAWSSDTARSAGTALVMANGIWLNNASITNGPASQRGTYVGTTRSNASSQLDWIIGGAGSGGVAAFLGVWNCYNRVYVGVLSNDNGASYTYSSLTIRQARASAGNQFSFVYGLPEDTVLANYNAVLVTAAVAGAAGGIGLGYDSTTAMLFRAQYQNSGSGIGSYAAGPTGIIANPIGFHFVAGLEASNGSNSITFNNNAYGGFLYGQLRM